MEGRDLISRRKYVLAIETLKVALLIRLRHLDIPPVSRMAEVDNICDDIMSCCDDSVICVADQQTCYLIHLCKLKEQHRIISIPVRIHIHLH